VFNFLHGSKKPAGGIRPWFGWEPRMKHYAIRPENKLIGISASPQLLRQLAVFRCSALFSGLLSSRVKSNISAMMIISVAMVLLLCVVEYIIWLWLRNPAIVIS